MHILGGGTVLVQLAKHHPAWLWCLDPAATGCLTQVLACCHLFCNPLSAFLFFRYSCENYLVGNGVLVGEICESRREIILSLF